MVVSAGDFGQIHHVYGMKFRNAACEQICDCKESNTPFDEYK
jgi:hypothetical protein